MKIVRFAVAAMVLLLGSSSAWAQTTICIYVDTYNYQSWDDYYNYHTGFCQDTAQCDTFKKFAKDNYGLDIAKYKNFASSTGGSGDYYTGTLMSLWALGYTGDRGPFWQDYTKKHINAITPVCQDGGASVTVWRERGSWSWSKMQYNYYWKSDHNVKTYNGFYNFPIVLKSSALAHESRHLEAFIQHTGICRPGTDYAGQRDVCDLSWDQAGAYQYSVIYLWESAIAQVYAPVMIRDFARDKAQFYLDNRFEKPTGIVLDHWSNYTSTY